MSLGNHPQPIHCYSESLTRPARGRNAPLSHGPFRLVEHLKIIWLNMLDSKICRINMTFANLVGFI